MTSPGNRTAGKQPPESSAAPTARRIGGAFGVAASPPVSLVGWLAAWRPGGLEPAAEH